MSETWFFSDPHFGHEATCTKFTKPDGSPLRPFKDADEMDAAMIKNWNDRVMPNDKVYVLGDVAMKEKSMHRVLPQLLGQKTLIRGNHDIFDIRQFLKYFREVHAIRRLDIDIVRQAGGVVMTHIPLHPGSLGRYGTNVHGHLHAGDVPDPRYLCVCVEHTDFAPINVADLLKRIKDKQRRYVNWKAPEVSNEHGPG